MAPRAKPKKKTAPIANGENKSNGSPAVAVKATTRGRKVAAEEKNAVASNATEKVENVVAAKGAKARNKPVPEAASPSAAPAKGNAKATKAAEKKPAAAKKTKATVKESNNVETPAQPRRNTIEENVAVTNSKTKPKATKKAAEPKAAVKSRGKTAVKDKIPAEAIVEENDEPAIGKAKPKSPKKAAASKVAAKPKGRAAKNAPKIDVVQLTSPQKKNASSQPSTSTVPLVEMKGRAKRQNTEAIEAIVESPKSKRGKKTTANEAKVDDAKRTAFSKKSKKISQDNGHANNEAAPAAVSPITKRKKAEAKPTIAEAASMPAAVAEKKTVAKRKAAEKPSVKDESDTEENEASVKKSRKKSPAASKAKATKKPADAEKPKMNATDTDFSKINFASDKDFNMKICSWNVAGLRAFVGKGCHKYFEHEQPNIICLQEIKCLQDEVPEEAKLKNYHPYWFSKPGGRGGVAILTKKLAHHVEYGLGNEEMDEEGRIITAEFEKFYLICVYVPNAGRKLVTLPRRLRWNKLFEKHVVKLNQKKPVIICGDMNVAHTEIDLANPKTNTKNAGFTQEERDGFTDLLALGFTDTFRYLHPSIQKAYTFWSYMGNARAKNVGWRLDYFITSDRLNPSIVDCFMRPEVLGSDHCPINLLLNV